MVNLKHTLNLISKNMIVNMTQLLSLSIEFMINFTEVPKEEMSISSELRDNSVRGIFSFQRDNQHLLKENMKKGNKLFFEMLRKPLGLRSKEKLRKETSLLIRRLLSKNLLKDLTDSRKTVIKIMTISASIKKA